MNAATATAVDSNDIASPTVDPTIRIEPKVSFRFKKDKLDVRRPSVELTEVPFPSAIGIAHALNAGGKKAQLIVDAVFDVIRGVMASYVADNLDSTQENMPWDKFSLDAISKMERADRRSVIIDDETWTKFGADYMEVMAPVSGKSKVALETAVQVYMKKMAPVKSNKEVLEKLKGQLALYIEHTKNGEEFQDVLELLVRRTENYLKADEPQILVENI